MRKGIYILGLTLILTFIFLKFGAFVSDKAMADDFNGYWSTKSSDFNRDFYLKNSKMIEMDSEGNKTTYKLIDTIGSYEIDPSSITDTSFFAGANTVGITNSGDVQYLDVHYSDGTIYEIKLYKVDKNETYFASTKGIFTTKNISFIAIVILGASFGLGQFSLKKKPVAE